MKTKLELMEESIDQQIKELNADLDNKENFKKNKSQESATYITLLEGVSIDE